MEQPNNDDTFTIWSGDLDDLCQELRVTGDPSADILTNPSSSNIINPSLSIPSSTGQVPVSYTSPEEQPTQVQRRESRRSRLDRKCMDHAHYRKRKNEALEKLNETLNKITGQKQKRTLIQTLTLVNERLNASEE